MDSTLEAFMSMVRCSLLVLPLLLGCSERTRPSQSQVDGGVRVDARMASTDMAPSANGILCLTTRCTMGQVCCGPDFVTPPTCTSMCVASDAVALACDGPSSCQGQPCCLSATFTGDRSQGTAVPHRFETGCQPSCLESWGTNFSSWLCNQNSDCSGVDGGLTACCTVPEFPGYHVCLQPSTVDAGDPTRNCMP